MLMAELQTLSVFGADLSSEDGWRLLNWCHHQGADEFAVFAVVCDGCSEEPLRPFDELVAPYRRPRGKRRHLSGPPGQGLIYETDLFELNGPTIEALRFAFPRGIFDYYPAASGWFEDLEVYRAGELMLGVITHEQEGVLRLRTDERSVLDGTGLPYRLEGQWVGY
jgi:hypothetical protein